MNMYGILVSFGAVLSGFLLYALSRRSSVSFSDTIRFTSITMFGGYVGARLLFQIQEIVFGRLDSLSLSERGHMFYGFYFGGLLFSPMAAKLLRLDWSRMINFCIPAWAAVQVFGRLGCFTTGCCSGREITLPWAVCRRVVSGDGSMHCVDPVQLYDAAVTLIIVILLVWFRNCRVLRDRTFLVYSLSYSLMRLVVDNFRDNSRVTVVFGLSVSQILSVGVIIVALPCLLFTIAGKTTTSPPRCV